MLSNDRTSAGVNLPCPRDYEIFLPRVELNGIIININSW
jgi:hypothetical protein